MFIPSRRILFPIKQKEKDVSVWGRYEGATSLRVVRLHPTPHRHKANPRHPLALAWRRCVCGVSGVACLPPSTRQVPGTSRTSSPLDRFSGGRFQEGGRWGVPPHRNTPTAAWPLATSLLPAKVAGKRQCGCEVERGAPPPRELVSSRDATKGRRESREG